MSAQKKRQVTPPPPSRIRKEEEEDHDEDEEVEEDQKMKLLEKAVAAIEKLGADNRALRKEVEDLKAKDDYPAVVDEPGQGVERESDSDHDATDEEEEAEVSEDASVKPVSDNTGTEDAFTGKKLKAAMDRIEALEKALSERDETLGTFGKAVEDGFKEVLSSVPRPGAAAGVKGIKMKNGGIVLRDLVNKAIEEDRKNCGSHSSNAVETDVFGFKSGRGDQTSRRKTARWMTKMFQGDI